jgi:hypothetical protein
MPSAMYAERHMLALYAECRYTKCRDAECHGALSFSFPFFPSKHYSNKVLVGFRKIAAPIGQKTFGHMTIDLILWITLLLHEI